MGRREENRQRAEETIAILKAGCYKNARGQVVDIHESLAASVASAVFYGEPETDALLRKKPKARYEQPAGITVRNETALQAARRLREKGHERVAVLNFASAKNPGGGFLKGSMAQEESLAAASGLYPTLKQMTRFYAYERERGSEAGMYADKVIFSPDVPVIRDDRGALLDHPYHVSFLTCPAVNAGVVRERNGAGQEERIQAAMDRRIEKILRVAAEHGQDALVLGAYGCGVFQNRPQDVARCFAKHLSPERVYARCFREIVFAVLDRAPGEPVYRAFQQRWPQT